MASLKFPFLLTSLIILSTTTVSTIGYNSYCYTCSESYTKINGSETGDDLAYTSCDNATLVGCPADSTGCYTGTYEVELNMSNLDNATLTSMFGENVTESLSDVIGTDTTLALGYKEVKGCYNALTTTCSAYALVFGMFGIEVKNCEISSCDSSGCNNLTDTLQCYFCDEGFTMERGVETRGSDYVPCDSPSLRNCTYADTGCYWGSYEVESGTSGTVGSKAMSGCYSFNETASDAPSCDQFDQDKLLSCRFDNCNGTECNNATVRETDLQCYSCNEAFFTFEGVEVKAASYVSCSNPSLVHCTYADTGCVSATYTVGSSEFSKGSKGVKGCFSSDYRSASCNRYKTIYGNNLTLTSCSIEPCDTSKCNNATDTDTDITESISTADTFQCYKCDEAYYIEDGEEKKQFYYSRCDSPSIVECSTETASGCFSGSYETDTGGAKAMKGCFTELIDCDYYDESEDVNMKSCEFNKCTGEKCNNERIGTATNYDTYCYSCMDGYYTISDGASSATMEMTNFVSCDTPDIVGCDCMYQYSNDMIYFSPKSCFHASIDWKMTIGDGLTISAVIPNFAGCMPNQTSFLCETYNQTNLQSTYPGWSISSTPDCARDTCSSRNLCNGDELKYTSRAAAIVSGSLSLLLEVVLFATSAIAG